MSHVRSSFSKHISNIILLFFYVERQFESIFPLFACAVGAITPLTLSSEHTAES